MQNRGFHTQDNFHIHMKNIDAVLTHVFPKFWVNCYGFKLFLLFQFSRDVLEETAGETLISDDTTQTIFVLITRISIIRNIEKNIFDS